MEGRNALLPDRAIQSLALRERVFLGTWVEFPAQLPCKWARVLDIRLSCSRLVPRALFVPPGGPHLTRTPDRILGGSAEAMGRLDETLLRSSRRRRGRRITPRPHGGQISRLRWSCTAAQTSPMTRGKGHRCKDDVPLAWSET